LAAWQSSKIGRGSAICFLLTAFGLAQTQAELFLQRGQGAGFCFIASQIEPPRWPRPFVKINENIGGLNA